MIAAITFSGAAWAWAALIAAIVLVPLAWFALRPATAQRGDVAIGLGLRTAGIGLLLLCLLDPQWTTPRAKKGANLVAVVADNSQGLRIADAGAVISRGEEMRAELGEDRSWVAKLEADFQVRRYASDASLRRVRDFSTLDFSGDRSDLGAAIRQLQERFAGQPLAGVVLFTDGNATDLPEGVGDVAGLPPIYPVLVGNGEGLHDVRIERADPRQTAFDDAPVSVQVDVAGSGIRGNALTVSIKQLGATTGESPSTSAAPAPQEVQGPAERETRHVAFEWRPNGTGVQFHEVTVAATANAGAPEATLLNNRRVVMFHRGRPAYRILYVGGRPNWEFKFLNRALLDDPQLQLVGLLRLALREPKFEFRGRAGEASNPLFRGFGEKDDTTRYDQPVMTRINTRDETELRGGFPRTAEELYAYDAVILDDVEAAFFGADQLDLLRRFVSERGGGLLMLGGVDTLENGRYGDTALAAALPVYLDRPAAKPPTGELTLSLTREGWLEPWARIRAQEADERSRLEHMPHFQIGNALGGVKPGATVLATLADEAGETYPALVSQPYGSGRVACLGIGDLWHWGMNDAEQHADLARFWRQVSRWLVTDVPAPVELRVVKSAAAAGVELRVAARDREYRPLELATTRITVRRVDAPEATPTSPGTKPEFQQAVLTAEPSADTPGRYSTSFAAREAGAYLATAEVTDRTGKLVGRAEAGWVNDPAAEEFRSIVPNRALMEELARRTRGAVLDRGELDGLADRLARAPAPVMETFSRPLWHNPWVFLAVLGCFVAEWGWRRWRGLP